MQTNTTFKTTEGTKNTLICMGIAKLSETDLDNILDNVTSGKLNLQLVISIWRRLALFVH